jgi:hypothetical protein
MGHGKRRLYARQDQHAGKRERKEWTEYLNRPLSGPDGKLPAIWRATIYYALETWRVFPLLDWVFASFAESPASQTWACGSQHRVRRIIH